ncbi:MAG: hypothetical protein LWX11_03720 [Firmicutes bacterium]|nr:hypothetical protein [Bacillota bacterium]
MAPWGLAMSGPLEILGEAATRGTSMQTLGQTWLRLLGLYLAVAPGTGAQELDPGDRGKAAEVAVSTGSELQKAEGLVTLDYQVLSVPGDEAIDLMGFHVHHKVTDWMYLGMGGYAPLLKGKYGGFMAFDVGVHLRQRLFGPIYGEAGVAWGGGGGGRSIQQSRILSGTGGFTKGYVGVVYAFEKASLGVNLFRMKFHNSVIDDTRFNVCLQVPFSYSISGFSNSGRRLSEAETRQARAEAGENTLSLGLDNLLQVRPEGTRKDTINSADLQFTHFVSRNAFLFASLGVGYRGLPLYNQMIGGAGYRLKVAPGFNLMGQLGVGSGGDTPDIINTDSGLLLYPKVSAEYLFSPKIGLSVSSGYLVAPKGTSKNLTVGAALNYHLGVGGKEEEGPTWIPDLHFQGYRFTVFHQSQYHVKFQDIDRDRLQMLAVQFDVISGDHLFIPIQAAIASNAYLGYPGYGELLAGVGLQTRLRKAGRWQVFGQAMVGTNVHGLTLKAVGGVHLGLSERTALHVSFGRTQARDSKGRRFSADSLGAGLSYRFSVPSR